MHQVWQVLVHMPVDSVATARKAKVKGVTDIAAAHKAEDEGMMDGHCRHTRG
jgi:hypothetical protein